jgi:hypothetical protein
MSSVLAATVPDVTKRNRYPLDIKPDRSCRSLDISDAHDDRRFRKSGWMKPQNELL